MIKAILFDFDGVLTIDKNGSTTITNYISKECGISIDLVKSCYYKYNRKLVCGEITHKDMWSDFCKDLGQAVDYQVLMDSFIHTALDKKMIDFIKELKTNYLIAMVTDNKCDRIDTILHKNNIQTYFDLVAVSAALHAGKDEIRIFQYVVDNLAIDPAECIFIDNTEKNLMIPNQMGMKTILFDDENRDFSVFKKNLDNYLLRS